MRSHKIFQNAVIIGLAALMSLCFAQTATAQGNLVVNGSFDTDASGWSVINVSGLGGYQSSFGNPAGSVFLYNLSLSPVPTASQEINSLTPGQLYTVSGDYVGGGKDKTENSFEVALDGVPLFETVAPENNSVWYSFSFDYTATSSSTLLSISAQLNGTGYPYYIDNITMDAVPEPNSLCLMGVGGMMSALFFTHRRKARRE